MQMGRRNHGENLTVSGGNRTTQTRSVGYRAPTGSATIEVTDLATLIRRSGLAEFAGPQRPTFDIVLQVLSGETSHEVDFTTYPLSAGDVLWVRAGQVQRWGDVSAIRARVILISAQLVDSQTAAFTHSRLGARNRSVWEGAAAHTSPFASALDQFVTAAHRVHDTLAADPDIRDHVLAQYAQGMLVELAALAPEGGGSPRVRHQTLDLLEGEIEASFALHRTAEWYAHHLGYSVRTLNRVAVAGTGHTTKELIDTRLVLEAKRLLVHESESVGSIATRLGFDDAANFSAYFRRLTDLSPREFRRRHGAPMSL